MLHTSLIVYHYILVILGTLCNLRLTADHLQSNSIPFPVCDPSPADRNHPASDQCADSELELRVILLGHSFRNRVGTRNCLCLCRSRLTISRPGSEPASTPSTSFRLELASASTARIRSLLLLGTGIQLTVPVSVVFPTPPFPATAIVCGISVHLLPFTTGRFVPRPQF